MKLLLLGCFAFIPALAQQPCQSSEELDTVPGSHIDAAHTEWPAQRASWLNDMKTPARKVLANQILTQIESIEKNSRRNFTLTGGVLKSSFSATSGCLYNRKNIAATYAFQLGCYRYLCLKNKREVSGEYSTVLRATVNPSFPPLFTNLPFDGKHNTLLYDESACTVGLALFGYVGFQDTGLMAVVNGGDGYYQDVPEEHVKKLPAGSSNYITRTWYIAKRGQTPFLPVSRKEFLESLLSYYEKEREVAPQYKATIDKEYAALIPRGYDERWYKSKMGVYSDFGQVYQRKKEAVLKLLQENTAEWLGKQAVVDVNRCWLTDPNKPDFAGMYTFVSFSEKETGLTIQRVYRYNPAYFVDESSGKPQLIRITFRYVKRPFDERIFRNFTENFDRAAWQKLVEEL